MNDECIAIVDEIFEPETTEKPFGKRWASQVIRLTPEHLHALQTGKFLAIDDQCEYVVYIQLAGAAHV